jgi:hypothetical protein
MQVNHGQSPNPWVQYGQADMDTGYPVTYARHVIFPGVQLHTGVDTIAMHKINTPAAAEFYGQTPYSPGQMRTNGQNQADFIPIGNSPSQWSLHTSMTAGLQPQNPGGPGQIAMQGFVNPGSGA